MIRDNDAGLDQLRSEYVRRRADHWDALALVPMKSWPARTYHRRLTTLYRSHVVSANSALEIGCGFGDLLAAVDADVRVGIDVSPVMVETATRRHPNCEFHVADATAYRDDRTYDVIILSDLVNEVWDLEELLSSLRRYCHSRTRIILNYYSRLWQLPLDLAQRVGLAMKALPQNWLTPDDVGNIVRLSGYEVLYSSKEVLLPLGIPILEPLFNKYVVRHWPFRSMALTNMDVIRPASILASAQCIPSVSVIVPARNEAGNLRSLVERLPAMGSRTEVIIVEGNSTDETYEVALSLCTARSDITISVLQQGGRGKGDAVRMGFARATGDILMILDADMTVPPEVLPRFYTALVQNHGEFINGVRLVYPLADRAMRFANIVGNKFFSVMFSWMLGFNIKDTLCGTKVLYARDYNRIAANRSYFGEFDPFGDFDLIFGAARLHLKIVDLPIRYQERTYGETNISRWRHGVILLRMLLYAARRIKYL